VCECGAHPPGPPKDRVVAPYAGEPDDLSPYGKFASPYDLNYTHPNRYFGAARDVPDPKNVTEVRIGFFGPIEHNPEQVFGLRMLHGAQLAIEEANTSGGYGGKPFKLMLHNDYDNWQAKTVYGEERPTDPTIWGSASNEVVKMVYDDQDWVSGLRQLAGVLAECAAPDRVVGSTAHAQAPPADRTGQGVAACGVALLLTISSKRYQKRN
jgi:hypothetical protein